MLARASEGFTASSPSTVLCHAGLATEIHPIVIDGQTVAVLQFGAFLEPEKREELDRERIDLHHRLMNALGARPDLADSIKDLLFDEALRHPGSDREWLRRMLPLIIERVIYRHLKDLSQESQMRKREEAVRTAAHHDVQLRLQAALAHADNHLAYLKDPSSKSWALRESAEVTVNSIELVGAVLHNLMRGEYLPEDYRFEQHDLREIITQAVSLAHPMAQQKKIVFQHEIKPDNMGIMLQASGIHLQQAFNNLIHNAVKYSYRASEYEGRFVTVRGNYAEHGYKIVITNYGVGILEEEYEKIFEPGYQGRLREKEYRTGSGQGLPLTRQIIEKHQGRISLCSKPMGEASTEKNTPYLTEFNIWLPLIQAGRAHTRRSS